MTPDERVSYIREVVWALSGRTPEEYRMTNAEFDAISKWMDKGIPLAVVLEAIQGFAGAIEAGRQRVLYVAPAVWEEWTRVRRARGG